MNCILQPKLFNTLCFPLSLAALPTRNTQDAFHNKEIFEVVMLYWQILHRYVSLLGVFGVIGMIIIQSWHSVFLQQVELFAGLVNLYGELRIHLSPFTVNPTAILKTSAFYSSEISLTFTTAGLLVWKAVSKSATFLLVFAASLSSFAISLFSLTDLDELALVCS